MTASTITPRRATGAIAVRELAIAFAVFLAYKAGRLVTNDSVEVARDNARRVVSWQAAVGADVERRVQALTFDVPGLIDALNHYYVYVHFPATVTFLVWVFVRRHERYVAVRNWFVGVTMTAMVIHVAFPLAPPRMLSGFVDTLAVFGPTIYSEDPSRSVANQFAAMPSLHFGWALMVGIALVVLTGDRHPRLRWLWLLHPAVTLLAIVATANHYLLDAAVAAALAFVVGAVVLRREAAGAAPDAATPAPRPPAGEPVPAVAEHVAEHVAERRHDRSTSRSAPAHRHSSTRVCSRPTDNHAVDRDVRPAR